MIAIACTASLLFAVPADAMTSGRDAALAPASRPDGSTEVYRPLAAVGASAQNPCYAPDNSQLLFTAFSTNYNNDNPPPANGTAGLYTVRASGGGIVTKIVVHSGNAAVNMPGTCYNATTGRIAYSSDYSPSGDPNAVDNIWTALRTGGNTEQQVSCLPPKATAARRAEEPTWSPDGKTLVFEIVDDTSGLATIWTIPSTNNCKHPIRPTEIVPSSKCPSSAAPIDDRQPVWSPDGTRIVFQGQTKTGAVNVFTVQPSGCGLTQITNDSNTDADPSWSPDSSRIVYSTDYQSPKGIANLFIVTATKNGSRTRLTSQCNYYTGAPAWSPDGRWVSFETWIKADPLNREDPTAIWRIPATAHPAAPTC